ncbi:hypothetical protein CAEBREN_25949 [Caenorhabditis brenneri]|uniref:Retrotransposon gag domain-containing protein n=1 Tax=Caenorhabditis brenneri TaxID=135651 RepID=G0NQV4_CAEBE|nr:hypothetical protein CAEBREN_25949 [Caenorhabditis brenneri]
MDVLLCQRKEEPKANPALEKYRQLTTEEKAGWERMTIAMVNLHQCELDKGIAMQQLTSIEQGKDDISKFAEKIKRLGEYAYDDIEKAARERLMATNFLNGASRELRTEIRRLKPIPKTIKEMVDQAKRIEQVLEIEATEEEEDGKRNANSIKK